ncbi:MAG: septum site-determining protein [Leptothrix sp. (in: Bacteria)]|nr:septum site-determining protein [Leptothrix sp. (in: b-proteobacteria)]
MSDHHTRLQSDHPSALPPSTRLGEFEVLGLLGVGGFGIVYLAFDHALEREVAVKEYMPASLAGRTETLHVSVRSQSDADTFALGLRSFVNEARLLARFDHPSLLKVHRFWEANGTAYMAMPVLRGRTVKEVRAEMPQPPDEAWLRALLGPLLGAIERLHAEGVYHRDIAPDNIQIEPDGHPVLLDFGAARHVISGKTQTLTAILKPAYAPIEQYAEVGAVKQGPWTDLYALGATLHYLLLNRPPPPATARAVHDDASALVPGACPGNSENFLRTIDWMLAPRPADRPQSVAALREVLDGTRQAPRRRIETEPAPSQWDRTVVLDAAPRVTTTPPPAAPASSMVDLDFDEDRTRVLPPAASVAPTAPTAPAAAPERADTAPLPAPTAVRQPAPPPKPAASAAPEYRDFAAPPVSAMLPPPSPVGTRGRWWPMAAVAAVLALAAGAVAMWPRAPATGDAPPLAASAAAESLAAQASAPESLPLPGAGAGAASAAPESRIATVVVPTLPAPRPPKEATPPPQAQPVARPVVERVPARTAVAPPSVTAAPQAAATPAAETGRATALTAPPMASAPAELPKPAVVAGPEAKCGERNPVRYFFCMERECLRSELASHPDCRKWRAEARREQTN